MTSMNNMQRKDKQCAFIDSIIKIILKVLVIGKLREREREAHPHPK